MYIHIDYDVEHNIDYDIDYTINYNIDYNVITSDCQLNVLLVGVPRHWQRYEPTDWKEPGSAAEQEKANESEAP